MNEHALVRETIAAIVVTLVDVDRNCGDIDRIATRLRGEFDVLLETPERAARALLAFASLTADALSHSTDVLPGDLNPRPSGL